MENKIKLYQKISAVMQDVQYIQKDDTVDTGRGKYRAISEEKVTETVRAALIKHGLVIFPVEQEHTREELRDKENVIKGHLSIVNTKYKICDTETGECEIIVSSGTGADTQDKGIGKAMTYGYKYLLLRTFAIPTGEDPDKVSSDMLDKQHEESKPVQRNADPDTLVKEIKMKWQTLNGSLDGLDAWMNEMSGTKGWNMATMNEALARSLVKRAEESNAPVISEKQVKLFNVKAGKEAANILKKYGFEKPEQITKDKFNEILKSIPEVITKDEDLPF